MNEMNALLSSRQRERFLDLLLETMVGRPELSPLGWIVQHEPAEKRLHLEEFMLDSGTSEEPRYLLALVVHDVEDHLVGCFPVTLDLTNLRPAGLRSALLQICNAPNGSVTAPKPIHLASPAGGGRPSHMEVSPEAQQVAFFAESMLRRQETLGVVVTSDWRQAMSLIQTFRPWMVRLPTHWWERSRRNEVQVKLLDGSAELTLVFVPFDVRLRLDRCLQPDACLQLTGGLGLDLTQLLISARRTVSPMNPIRVRSYRRNVTDGDSTPTPLPTSR